MKNRYVLTGGCSTDRGVVKEKNEDAVFFRCIEKNGISIVFGAVCDGISGLESGEIASGYIVSQITAWVDTVVSRLDFTGMPPALLFSHMKDAAEEWNYGLYTYLREQNISSGTTMSLLMLTEDHYYIIHVGDSRIYRFVPGMGMQQITADASITVMEEGRMRSYLDNFMGKQSELVFSAYDGSVNVGDLFLYCSDGGYHRMTDEDVSILYNAIGNTISNAAGGNKAADQVCHDMLDLMLSRGERDNLTLGVIRIDPAPRHLKPRFRLFGRKKQDQHIK